MICKYVQAVNSPEGITDFLPKNMSLTQPEETFPGRFNCWMEKTSFDHHAVMAKASALISAHRRGSESEGIMNRQAH